MKKLFILLFAMVACIGFMCASNTSVGGIWYDFNSSTKTATVTYRGSYPSYYSNEYTGAVTIPATVTYSSVTYNVTSIGSSAFYNCTGVTSVTIPSSVTSVAGDAFSGCTGLPVVDNIRYAGTYMVEVTDKTQSSYTIKAGTRWIGNSAFSGCSNATSISVPNSVIAIGSSVFSDCPKLESINIPNGVTSIANRTFNNCSSLTSLTIPDGVTSIGEYAFQGCSSLTSVTIPNSVTSIGSSAFNNCKKLESINIPNSITSVADYTFSNCSSLTSITIPSSVTSIESGAFYNCISLPFISVPNSVSSINGWGVFYNVANVIYDGEASGSPWNALYVNGYTEGNLTYTDNTKTELVRCPKGATGDIVIPNSVTTIRQNAFSECNNLSTVTIPNSVTSIGNSAFYNVANISYSGEATGSPWGARCLNGFVEGNLVYSDASKSKLLSCYTSASGKITIPNSVTSIGDRAFLNCALVTSITLPNSVTTIGYDVFNGCSGLTSPVYNSSYFVYMPRTFKGDYTIPDGIKEIYSSAFASCDSITSVTIPNSVTSIGSNAFSECRSITSIVIPDNVTQIQSSTFSGCNKLTSITIPSSVTRIDGWAFYNCYSLGSLDMPNSITQLGEYVFYECNGLKRVKLSSGLIDIPYCCFYSCDALQSVRIPNGVEFIKNGAFAYCHQLTKVTLPRTLKQIEDDAFATDYDPSCSWCDYKRLDTVINRSCLPITAGLQTFGKVAWHATMLLTEDDNLLCDDGFCFEVEGTDTTLVSVSNSSSEITLPSRVRWYDDYENRYSIANGAFSTYTYDRDNNQVNENQNYNATKLVIPQNVIAIGSLRSLPNLEQVEFLPGSQIKTLENAFAGTYSYCSGCGYDEFHLERLSSIVLPDHLENIGARCFKNCRNLSSINIPESVTSIGEEAFYQCSGLKEIKLPKNLTFVGRNAFAYNQLSTIAVPDIVNNVSTVFYQSNNVSEYVVSNTHPTYSAEDGILYNKGKNKLIAYPVRKQVDYAVTIPTFVDSIADNALTGGFTRVNVPVNVKYIGQSNSGPVYYVFDKETPLTIHQSAFGSSEWLLVKDTVAYKAAWPQYKSHILFIGDAIRSISATAQSSLSSVHKAIGDKQLEGVIELTVSGSINSYDLMIMRNKMINLKSLDITDARVVANSYQYYTGYHSHNDSLINYSFRNLLSIKLPSTLKYASSAISECGSLRYLELNGGVVGPDMCPASNLTVVLNEGVTGISTGAFNNNLAQISLPASLGSITQNTFKDKTGLHTVTMADGIESIDASAFSGCTALTKITLSPSIKTIGANAFYDCPALNVITLPESLERIYEGAFRGTGLKEITIPANVKYIGNKTFCLKEEGYNYYSNNRTYDTYYDNSGSHSTDYYNYSQRPALTRVYFQDNSKLDSIGAFAFWRCPIDSINLPDSLSYIGNSAFLNCTNLHTIVLSKNSHLKQIEAGAFVGSSIDTLRLGDSLKTIGAYSFYGSGIRLITFSNKCSVTTIPKYAFSQSSLDSIQLPKSLKTIHEYAFGHSWNEGHIRSLKIPESVTTIGESAFARQRYLKKVSFPNSLIKIENNAFVSCYSIDSLSFPTSLQTIGDRAFQSCTSLKELRVPSTLLSVGDYAFSGCDQVKKVYTYTVEPVSINQNTFSCWRSADLYVPTTSYYTYYYNTQWSQFLSLKEFDEEYTYFYINNDYELDNSTGTIDGKPDADLNSGSGLIVSGDSVQNVGTVTVQGDEDGAASIIACEDNLLVDSLVVRLRTRKNHWSYFCFPFDLSLDQIYFPHQYVIRSYDGAARAKNGKGGWINLVGNQLHRGTGYIFQGAQTDTLVIRISNPQIGCADYRQIIFAYSSGNSVNSNWNFIGNPFPSWYDLNALFTAGFSSPIYIWDALVNDYHVYRPGDDDYHLHPYEGFFTQPFIEGVSMYITWSGSGRETETQARDKQNNANHAPARIAERRARQELEQRKLINLQLSSDTYSERTRIVFNDAASMDYELGRDAVVMDGGTAPIHIWSIAPDNSRLAINERPFASGQVSLGYDVSDDGYYTLSATRMDTGVIIYDNVLQQEVDLSVGDYSFYTEAGTNTTRFAISRIKATTEVATDISEVSADEVARDERVNIYTPLGLKLYDNVRLNDAHLPAGVYVIEGEAGATKHLSVGE